MESKSDEIGHVTVSLKRGEKLQVGEEVSVQVISPGGRGTGKGARLRVTAPKRIKVFRIKEEEDAKPEPK